MCDLFASMTISKYHSLEISISPWIFRTVSNNHNLLKGQDKSENELFPGKHAEKCIIYSWDTTINPNSRMYNCGAIQTLLELQAKTFTNDKLLLAPKRKKKNCHNPAHRLTTEKEKREENMKGR